MSRSRSLDLWGCWALPTLPVLSPGLSLEVLSLPSNSVSSLANLPATLTHLYLQNNRIPFEALSELRRAPSLTYLMLAGNPCASHPLFTDACLLLCPALERLDTLPVTAELRAAAERSRPALASLLSSPPPSPAAAHQANLTSAALLLLQELSPASLEIVKGQLLGMRTQGCPLFKSHSPPFPPLCSLFSAPGRAVE